ncbi:MAG: SRPBCC domain-containing protein [Draconibacterium sp.]|nr:SRPBCC domain-containing protein [Draconibacterium sp.]
MPNIRHNLLIGASAGKIHKAITSEEGLSAWWTPNTKAKVEVNSVARFPFGNGYYKEMKITELNPFELVKWSCIKGDVEWVGTNISFILKSSDKKNLLDTNPEILGQIEQQSNEETTMLIFQHDNWKDYTPMFAECSYTWAQFLRSLKLLCETGKGRPWPNQHQL